MSEKSYHNDYLVVAIESDVVVINKQKGLVVIDGYLSPYS